MIEKQKKLMNMLLIGITFVIICVSFFDSIAMIGKPFSGFLIKYENIVNQNTLWYWSAYPSHLNYLDVVLKVDGNDVVSSNRVYDLLSGTKAGDNVNYQIRRASGQIEEVSLPVMEFGFWDFLLSYGLYFAIAISFFSIAVFTYLKRPDIKLGSVFLFLSSIASIWFATVIGGRVFWLNGILSSIGWVSQFVLGAVLFHFGLVFLEEKKYFSERKSLQILPYVIALPALLIFSYSTAVIDVKMIVQSAIFSLYYLIAGFIFTFGAFYYIRMEGKDTLIRQRARILLFGLGVASLTGILAIVFALWSIQIPLSFVLIPVVFLPVIFSYSILRYNPYEIDSIIRKALNTIAIIGLIVLAFNFFVRLSEPLGYLLYRSPVFSILFILFFLFSYDGLDYLFGKLVTRYVFGSRVDFPKLTAKINDSISTMLNIEKITHTVKSELTPAFNLKHIEMLLLYPGEQDYRSRDKSAKLEVKHDLMKAIKENKGIALSIYDFLENPDYGDISEKCVAKMKELQAVLIIPLAFRETLTGLLILGEREERALYYNLDELGFLKNLAFQIAVAIENAKLYENLANSKDVIEEIHTNLEKKVEERTLQVKEKTAELDRLNDQLRMATQRKTEFLANMSHELRTPLNAVLGYAALVKEGIYGEVNEKVKQAVTEMESSGNHLLGLINDVLDLSRVESGKIELDIQEFTVKDIMSLVEFSTKPLLDSKGLYLKFEINNDLPLAYGDEKRINQVLINLIGNSAKFTFKGGIIVRVIKKEVELLFEVEDTGIGIKEDKIEDVFKEFKQVHVGEYGGTGLGLVISKKIVEMHGGKIWIESAFEKGTKFSFLLPLKIKQNAGA